MACEKPIRVYPSPQGGRVRFWKKTDPAYWVEPYTGQSIPCGYCILCRENQAREWAIRITHEAQMWAESSFVTLSYNTQHAPPDGGLRQEDLQKFWKRMRKNYGPMRYYAVGEYGDKNHRPHYHAAIFGHAFTDNRRILRTTPTLLWDNPMLVEAWGQGYVSVGALNFKTASYTASYMMKKLVSKQKYVRTDEETGELIALEQPRAWMSRNLARDWFKKFGEQVYDHDYVVIQDKKQKPPKQYDKWMKSLNPLYNEIKMRRIKERRIKEAIPQTTAENRARARNAHARAKQRMKSI